MSTTGTLPLNVLSVEDNPGDARLIGELLVESDLPFSVENVDRLSDGLARLRVGGIDVVLLDLSLPDSSGLETLKAMRAEAPDVPIVVLTGHGDEPQLGLEAVRQGAEDYLVKGELVPSHLGRALTHAIERRAIQRKLDESRARLQQQAFLDPLTQLLNRRGLERTMRDLHRAGRGGDTAAALLIDLDEFKRINDTLGHSAGDRVLEVVADVIRSNVRPDDPVARIGGDEFLVFFPGASAEEAVRVAERLRLAMGESPIQLSSGPLRVTASMGLASFSGPVYALAQLIGKTQHALHRSKESGKYRVSVLEEEHDERQPAAAGAPPHVDLLVSLPRGDALRIVRQPIVRLSDERVIGYELLTRGPAGGTYEDPQDLFRLCSEYEMRGVVDLKALELGVLSARDRLAGLRHHLNLFPATLIDVGPERVLELFPPDVPAGAFCIELSARHLEGDPASYVPCVQALQSAGILIAIDDIGCGRSPLEAVLLLEPQVLKVDRAWIDGIAHHAGRRRAVQRLRQLARSLEAELVAEGVESEDDLIALRDLGVDLAQGFYWARPSA